MQEVRERKEEAERKEKRMTIEEKREYIKRAFRDYVNNKRRLEMLNIPGLGGVDYSRPSVVSDHSNGTEKTVLRYIDKKDTLEKQVEIVKRTIEHYKIEDKKHGGGGKASYIYNRWLRRLSFRKAAIQSHIAESTSAYWTEEIFFTAEIIAEEYQLF